MEGFVQPLLESPEFLGKEPNHLEGGSGNKKTADLAAQFHADKGHNVRYAVYHGVCEGLCLVVGFLQIKLTDYFLNGDFLKFGPEVLSNFSGASLQDPMRRTFPIVTTCNISTFGGGGHEKILQAVCVLPNNIVHQKFYLFLWFWLFAVAIVTLLHQLYRVCLLCLPAFRALVTKTWSTSNDKNDPSLEVDDLSVLPDMDELVRDLSYPDWIVLSLIHTNLTAINFNNFLQDLAFQQKNSQK